MTNDERDLFVKANTLLTVATFFSEKNKKEAQLVAEQIQDALIIHASNLLANLNEKKN